MALVDDLIQSVGRSAGMSPQQARGVVGDMLRFLAARLPSPLFGELQAWLSAEPGRAPGAATGRRPPAAGEAPDDHRGR
jgi:hypothetical protein